VSEKRVRAYSTGCLRKALAALLLRLRGHRIIARPYKTPIGEIDLVAFKGNRLAFVDVKQRKSFEDAGWSTSHQRAAAHRQGRAVLARWTSRLYKARTSPSMWCWPRFGPGPATSRASFRFDNRCSALPLTQLAAEAAIHHERGGEKARGLIKSPRPLWERAFRRDLAREACASGMAGRVRGNC
jgi:Holliday junction resolvase-like predicted endonuclease